MTKKFLTSVANAYMYDDSTGALLAVGKTLLDSSVETTLGKTDVRAGRGNQLQYIYYHTSEMNITINDAQWNLDYLSMSIGSDITSGTVNIFEEETITLVAKAGSVTNTPLAVSGAVIYGWVTLPDGSVEKVTFAGKNFTASTAAATDTVCVRYYALDTAARSITVNSNMIPSIVHLVLEAQLNSSDSTTNQIGYVQIDVPKASLTGAFTIKMTADGVASTPLAARALANVDTTTGACTSEPYYATIKEIITGGSWWDNVIGIAFEGGDFNLAQGATATSRIWAIPSTGLPFRAPTSTGSSGYMTFASGTTAVATIVATSGIVTGVTGGTSTLHATVSGNTGLDAYAIVTVTVP
jgi:hypothetical protein